MIYTNFLQHKNYFKEIAIHFPQTLFSIWGGVKRNSRLDSKTSDDSKNRNKKEQKYVLITSLKTETLKGRLLYLTNLISNIIILSFFFLTSNKIKFLKYKNKVWEIYTYKTPKNYGHPAVNKSLIRGLRKANIPFSINKISDKAENIIVLWTTKSEFETLEKLKQEGKIKRIIITPECASPEDKISCDFGNNKNVDLILLASQWAKEAYIKNVSDKNLHQRVIPWPSGVELFDIPSNKKIQNSCICYFKKTPVNNDIIELCDSLGIKVYTIEYLKYRFAEYMEKLEKSDFVIFFQDYIETQGLAMAEAWTHNKPTLINYLTNEFGGITSPYLTKDTGLHYENLQELKDLLIEYKENPQKFLDKFSPRKWVEENLSDEVTVKELIKIIDNENL